MSAPLLSAGTSIRRLSRVGLGIVALLGIVVGGWAFGTEISGAVIAEGAIVVDNNVKKVQHPNGGVVGEIHARDGDHVRAGDVLISFDGQTDLTRETDLLAHALNQVKPGSSLPVTVLRDGKQVSLTLTTGK